MQKKRKKTELWKKKKQKSSKKTRFQVPMCGNDCDPQHGFCTKPGECR